MQAKWDAKYQQAAVVGDAANVLLENQHLLPKTGIALDFACGLGANALLLAKAGLTVSAWDLSPVAIEKLNFAAKQQQLNINAHVRDVVLNPPEQNSVDVLVVSYFLDRRLCLSLLAALKPKGTLFYQTYCQQKVNDIGPKNPDFLLKENELLNLFPALKIRVYREEAYLGNHQQGWRNQAMLVAQKQ